MTCFSLVSLANNFSLFDTIGYIIYEKFMVNYSQAHQATQVTAIRVAPTQWLRQLAAKIKGNGCIWFIWVKFTGFNLLRIYFLWQFTFSQKAQALLSDKSVSLFLFTNTDSTDKKSPYAGGLEGLFPPILRNGVITDSQRTYNGPITEEKRRRSGPTTKA